MRNALAAIALTAFLLGCASTQNTAGKLLASSAVTVDGAMRGWAAWVAQGQATDDQQAKVRTAYAQYQSSMAVAQASFNTLVATGDASNWEKASTVLTANQQALMALTQMFVQQKAGTK